MAASTVEFEQGDPQVGLLAAVRASKQAEMAEQVHQLHLVIEYCAAHGVEETDTATYVEFGRDTGLALAGPGAPFVSEFAVLELAAALGMTPDACKRYVGQVLEVHHRLGRLWARVVAGQLPFWRAGRIAQHTMALPAPGAAHVDQHLAAGPGHTDSCDPATTSGPAGPAWPTTATAPAPLTSTTSPPTDASTPKPAPTPATCGRRGPRTWRSIPTVALPAR